MNRCPVLRIQFLAILALPLTLAGCGRSERDSFQGYVEGEYVYLAAPQGGYLKSLDAPRGSRVAAAQPLFTLAGDPDAQALAEAEARAGSARDRLQNLKDPRRPSETAALEASLRAAEAAQKLADIQWQKQDALARQNFVSPIRLAEARSALQQATAQADAARQQLASFRSSVGRTAELHGAEADAQAAGAMASQKRWVVERKVGIAPTGGEIAETYYRPGEWVPAGAAVVSLLPDSGRRLRFFVPESIIASLKPGLAIDASCDGCGTPIPATIDFIAAQAEYTPPILYSRGSREKLVFRVEAVPAADQAARLRPGLPLDVRLRKP